MFKNVVSACSLHDQTTTTKNKQTQLASKVGLCSSCDCWSVKVSSATNEIS